MAIRKLPAAAEAVVVLVPGAAGHQHSVEQGPVAVLSAGETPGSNTPWT
ncbi:hypothetical protein ACIQU1_21980 [Streptomyces angustmyceticus]